ncbi:response regulator transcription factor (plasmid) [Peteryoungia desertarenae]|uniref:Response regulator transcription factor n=1 Tax=Peteryoungia desertarenae TaxID=1813451 RepID=A0ABX6QU50_9HYPH|nr:response regulator transcription factor [Peteryoungia desertarenae]QLF71725.1 response regulator transcription factor [Peteryoungia desertarenae]
MQRQLIIYSSDPDFYMLMSHILATAGYGSSPATDLQGILDLIGNQVLAILLDTSDELEDLIELCHALRRSEPSARQNIIALIRARHEESYFDFVKAGVTECFMRPISPERLLAYLADLSLEAESRSEPSAAAPTKLRLADLSIDEQRRLITGPLASASLSPIEFRLFMGLMSCSGQVVTRQDLVSQVWPGRRHVSQRSVDVHITKLRRCVARTSNLLQIRTIRSSGYALDVLEPGD